MKTKHHPLRTILLSLLILLLLVLVVFVGFYFTRLQTIQSIEQITDYDDGYNLYRMNVQYDYSLDREYAFFRQGFEETCNPLIILGCAQSARNEQSPNSQF